MRALFLLQFILTAGSIGWVLHRQTAEHDHARAAGDVAVRAHGQVLATTHAQAQLDADVTTALRDQDVEWGEDLQRLCSTLAVLVRMTPGRAQLPAEGRAVCPGVEPLTSGALFDGDRRGARNWTSVGRDAAAGGGGR